MATRDWIEVVSSLIGGAGIGAAVMYLFDPDRGEKRRAYLRDQAADAASSAHDTLEAGWNSMTGSARSAGRYVADQAGGWLDGARDQARHWGRDAAQRVGGYGRQLHRQAGSYLGYDQGPSAGTISGVAVGICSALAVGAGLMFLLDPEKGQRRRQIVREKAIEYGNTAGQYVSNAAHAVSEKAKDVADKVSHVGEQVKDQAKEKGEQVKDKVLGAGENARGHIEQSAAHH